MVDEGPQSVIRVIGTFVSSRGSMSNPSSLACDLADSYAPDYIRVLLLDSISLLICLQAF